MIKLTNLVETQWQHILLKNVDNIIDFLQNSNFFLTKSVAHQQLIQQILSINLTKQQISLVSFLEITNCPFLCLAIKQTQNVLHCVMDKEYNDNACLKWVSRPPTTTSTYSIIMVKLNQSTRKLSCYVLDTGSIQMLIQTILSSSSYIAKLLTLLWDDQHRTLILNGIYYYTSGIPMTIVLPLNIKDKLHSRLLEEQEEAIPLLFPFFLVRQALPPSNLFAISEEEEKIPSVSKRQNESFPLASSSIQVESTGTSGGRTGLQLSVAETLSTTDSIKRRSSRAIANSLPQQKEQENPKLQKGVQQTKFAHSGASFAGLSPTNDEPYVEESVAALSKPRRSEALPKTHGTKVEASPKTYQHQVETLSKRSSSSVRVTSTKSISNLSDKLGSIYLPVRLVSHFRHVEFGMVKVIATWFYMDESVEEYPYRFGNANELFTPQMNVATSEYSLDMPGKRVCMFHMIESVEPKTCPLQYLVGDWFSSFTVSADKIGNPREGWDAWKVMIDPVIQSESTAKVTMEIENDVMCPSMMPHPSTGPRLLFPLASFLGKKHPNTIQNNKSMTQKIMLPWLGAISLRDLMACLCCNECDEHTCHVDMMVMDQLNWAEGSNKTCPHGKNTTIDDGGDQGLVFYRDNENVKKATTNEVEAEISEKDKRELTRHIAKMARINQAVMKTPWGNRIVFQNVNRATRLERLVHPHWYKRLFARLEFIRTENRLISIIPYQFHHFLPLSFIETKQDLQDLSTYFECDHHDDQHILFLSMFSPTPTIQGTRSYVTVWKLRREYTDYIQVFRLREDFSEDFYNLQKYGRQMYLYVPIHENLLYSNNMIHNPQILENLALSVDQSPNSPSMLNLTARKLWLKVYEFDSPDYIRMLREIDEIERCMYSELSLWNGIYLPDADQIELDQAELAITRKLKQPVVESTINRL